MPRGNIVVPPPPSKAVAANEVGAFLVEVAEARHIEAAGAAVVERGRLADQVFARPATPGPMTCSQKLWPT